MNDHYYRNEPWQPTVWSLCAIGLAIGTLAGVIISAGVAGCMLWSGAPPERVWDTCKLAVPLILAVTAPTCALMNLLRYQRAVMGIVLPQNAQPEPVGGEETGVVPREELGPMMPAEPTRREFTLADQIASCAKLQAQWHWQHDTEPTRDAFQEMGVSQPIWNSARDILRAMGLHEGSGWSTLGWEPISALLDRISVDEHRIWVPMVAARGLRPVTVLDKPQGNRYTALPD